ncbi:hypothetical protein BIV57_18620 [Mangrovactinospora gilvigrisea]|uniref:O-antigen ligase-related domain-containing protein n=1 Tax=Mangrovactinospora gilvigrisea TaxID=1428644 RepID=A0A1J7BBD1_9ACTN|nr:lipid II flippase MurJ [Mangrovactinospora gilvigrisea]OIV35991.1 hypothetical protein BIV57_18620 [Mangrovactinospora gilvigrisea]
MAALLGLARGLVRRPAWLAAATAVLVCVPTGNQDVSASFHIGPADVASLLLVCAVAMQALLGRVKLPRRMLWPAGALTAAFAISAITAVDTSAALSGFIRYIQIFVLVPSAVALSLRERRDLRLVLGAVLTTALFEGVYGTVQYLTHTGASYDGQNIRAVGTFGALDIMGMSTVVSFGMIAALGLALTARRTRNRVLLLLAAAFFLAPLVFSLSRGSWIAVSVALVALALLSAPLAALRGAVVVIALAVIVIGGFGVGSATVGQRLSSITSASSAPDQSVDDRYALWATAENIWRDRPITGVGLKGFPVFRDGHAGMQLSAASDAESQGLAFTREPLLSPHNMYLLVLSEQGLIGMSAFLLLMVGMLVLGAQRLIRVRVAGRQARVGRGALSRSGFGAGPAAFGLGLWIAIDFLYADIGGADTVLTAVALGVAVWWAFGEVRTAPAPPAADAGRAAPTSPAGLPSAVPPPRRPWPRVPEEWTSRGALYPPEAPTQHGFGRPAGVWPAPLTRGREPSPPGVFPFNAGSPLDAVMTPAYGIPAAVESAAAPPRRRGRGLLRATGVTAVLSAAGSILGLLRDLLIARYFGATRDTDAFLVAWTVPETAAPLLIEDAMAFLMVPAFSRTVTEAARRSAEADADGGTDGDTLSGLALNQLDAVREAVRGLVAATLPRIALGLAVFGGIVLAGAPLLVHGLAPGLEDVSLAVTCTRLTAATVLLFGLAGYLSAALRAHHVFGAPAGIYVAYNVGILALLIALHSSVGIKAAAGGVALGALLMILVQLPGFLRILRLRRKVAGIALDLGLPSPVPGPRTRTKGRGAKRFLGGAVVGDGRALAGISMAAFVPIAVFTLSRQAQVFVERFLASELAPGTISYLNYATKVAQVPMSFALILSTVTFPLLSRHLAAGRMDAARRRIEADLGGVSAVTAIGAAFMIACAPQLVQLLFQRGEFTPADTAATASVMRVYLLGLLGQALVGALVRPFFSGTAAGGAAGVRRDRDGNPAGRITRHDVWFPAWCMLTGLVLTGVVGELLLHVWGAKGIALANAVGITVPALMLLVGLKVLVVRVSITRLALRVGRCLIAAGMAGVTGWALADAVLKPHGWPPIAIIVVCAVVMGGEYLMTGYGLGAEEITGLLRPFARRGEEQGAEGNGAGGAVEERGKG